MKKIVFLIVAMLILGNFAWGQSNVSGTAIYRLQVSGRVNFSGSDCGINIKGGLEWIAATMQNGTHIGLVQGSEPYPSFGNGLRNVNFSGSYNFTKNNKVTTMTYGTTHRNSGLFGICGDVSY